MKKTLIASAVALGLGVSVAQAAQVPTGMVPAGFNMWTDSANFTMLQPNGALQGGTNDVTMTWDGTVFTSITDYTGPGSTANITASSTTPFSSNVWTAHEIQAFGTGTYTFDTTIGDPVDGDSGATDGINDNDVGLMTMTVLPGQIGMHMLFDWGGNHNIDVAVVATMNAVFGSGVAGGTPTSPGVFTCGLFGGGTGANCLFDGVNYGSAGQPAGNQVWMLASIDPDGDGIPGVPMPAGGPFAFFNANFNANMVPVAAVPVPAAAWLFGSGLVGLVGVARRRKSA